MTRFAEPVRRLAVLAVAPMLMMAAACGGDAEGDASGGQTFVLKVTDGANAGPLAVGKRDGSFDEALAPLGARVEWVEAAPSVSANLKLFSTGELDVSEGAFSPVVGALSKDVDLRIVAAAEQGGQDQSGIIARPDSGIDSVEDLEGKRVAVNPAAKGEYLTLLALEQAGVSVDSVDRVPLQIKDGASAFSTGQVDAWASFNAPYQEAKANGAVELVSEGDLGSQDRKVLLVRGSVAEERPDVVAAFLETLQDLVIRQVSEPEDFQNVFTTTGPTALTGTRLEDAIAVGRQALPPVPPGEDDAAALEEVSRVFTEYGVTPDQLSAQDVFLDLRPLISPEQAARIDRGEGQ
ncbi:ABC transporter substrate-binding protein [Dietzia sp. UCD-THP]|uniref:NrtA/SsuA/CpmA family ABC transporter substrate-binding protein n=1 Tax=Dietzia sp. UCD-THP TaxID=1292020 RepID=UPI0003656EF2|nr:NrtA/SsuA/CpmA family ABC transporter substrate-binding protein [Dietzia sp. UCD-THP]EYT62338.1 ABC transporter substrate-binding protein [Dietzia sp. UCD-THP]